MLDAALHPAHADRELADWRTRVAWLAAAAALDVAPAVRRSADGARAALALTAPVDALLSATLLVEWAWMRAATDGASRAAHTGEADEPRLPWDERAAVDALRAHREAERNDALRALHDAATRAGVPVVLDEEALSLGYGTRGRTWPLHQLPAAADVPWGALGCIPVGLVTGSNGKTTTVRLVAAMLARAGHVVGFSCSDGVFIAGERVERGDWSGPAGARRVLRDPRVTAAVLETARGGILRRGLACPSADAALVTNIAEDHLGGYGIATLEDLAAVKLVVARALGAQGALVLNRDDATLRTCAHGHAGPVCWFTADAPPAVLPPVAEMPLTLGGAARHNVANLSGAAELAARLGVPPAAIRAVATTFGAANSDNPGRLERFERDGVRIWIDYAHNPHGLDALLGAAAAARGSGRLGLLLGQAGDRDDAAIRALARAAWAAAPDRVVLKDLDGYLRGRAPGEVPALLRATLLDSGAPAERLDHATDETDGVRRLLAWARPGDLLVLPVHALEARERAIALVQNRT